MAAVVTGRIEVLHDQTAEFARAQQKQRRKFDWNGGSWGIQATILYEPSHDVTVIVLQNASNAGPTSHDVALDLLQAAENAN
jgi:hypothetical protein